MSKWPEKETDLFPLVKTWLESRGATVYAEVQDMDVVGVLEDGTRIVVELKRSFSKALLQQLWKGYCRSMVHEVWGAIASKPRNLEVMRSRLYRHAGLIRVFPDRIEVVQEATRMTPCRSPVLDDFMQGNVGGSVSQSAKLTPWQVSIFRVWKYLLEKAENRWTPIAEIEQSITHFWTAKTPSARRAKLSQSMSFCQNTFEVRRNPTRGTGGMDLRVRQGIKPLSDDAMLMAEEWATKGWLKMEVLL